MALLGLEGENQLEQDSSCPLRRDMQFLGHQGGSLSLPVTLYVANLLTYVTCLAPLGMCLLWSFCVYCQLLESITVLLSGEGWFCLPLAQGTFGGTIWTCLWLSQLGFVAVLLTSGEWRPGILLNLL